LYYICCTDGGEDQERGLKSRIAEFVSCAGGNTSTKRELETDQSENEIMTLGADIHTTNGETH
jgi:hypothetical protein